MSDISASERRLSAALDRIDQWLEAGGRQPPAAAHGDDDLLGLLSDAQTEIARLEAEVEALRAARDGEIAQMGELMSELERLLAGQALAGNGVVSPEGAGDAAGVPEEQDVDPASGDHTTDEGR
ncbi:hypothetical protein [Paracoccus sp. (in: a-proteobacteria)]|uniref:hypothetical protein n=1 Tax=Paracoccus sp. TaxID=267 RepID=UPI003A8B1DF1